MLPLSISPKRVQSIAWGYHQVSQFGGQIYVFQSPYSSSDQVSRQSSGAPTLIECLRFSIDKSLYNVICHVTLVKETAQVSSPDAWVDLGEYSHISDVFPAQGE
jgi:hypothetical protein